MVLHTRLTHMAPIPLVSTFQNATSGHLLKHTPVCVAEMPAELLQAESDDESEAPDNVTGSNAATTTAALANAEDSEAESSSGGEEESEEDEDSEEEEGSGGEDEQKSGGGQEVNVDIDQLETSAATEEPVDCGPVEGLQAVAAAAPPVSTGLEPIAA